WRASVIRPGQGGPPGLWPADQENGGGPVCSHFRVAVWGRGAGRIRIGDVRRGVRQFRAGKRDRSPGAGSRARNVGFSSAADDRLFPADVFGHGRDRREYRESRYDAEQGGRFLRGGDGTQRQSDGRGSWGG